LFLAGKVYYACENCFTAAKQCGKKGYTAQKEIHTKMNNDSELEEIV